MKAARTPPPSAALPPSTRTTDDADVLHGTRVPDPYRWLEDGDAPEVLAWTARQNAFTRAHVDALPERAALAAEATQLLQVGYVAGPAVCTRRDGLPRYFHTRREGAQDQPTLYVRDGHDGEDRVLLDVAALSDDGTSALDWWYPSWDGAYVAWGRSESGSEESVLLVRDVATGRDLEERIPDTRHASVAWMPDGRSFYYARHPALGTVPPGDEKYHARIFHHVIGQDPRNDALVFGEGREKTDIPSVSVSPSGRWLVVRVHMGWDRSEIHVRDLHAGPGAPWVTVAAGRAALFEPIPLDDRLLVMTNEDAPRYALFAVSYDAPERARWTPLLPERADVLEGVTVLRSELVAAYMHEAETRLERFGHDGTPRGSLPLPGIGSASVAGAHDRDEAFITFTSFVEPWQVFRVDLAGDQARDPRRDALQPWDRVGAAFDAGDVVVERMTATSRDGTPVPMFVVARRGFLRDGKTPTVLYGYGGFNVNVTPAFSPRALTAVLRGAVWVTAVLRGGGELGEAWHQAGMRERKQNVFDDFVACAEHLIREGITDADHLGIVGGSNGGLLVAAAVTQRPELFRAGLSLVPLTDMLRYHHFRIAKLWIPEYGDPDAPADFTFLHAYSPYHHVREGVRYPAMLFGTAESDSRVDPMHARKMAARMQAVQADPARPILLRVEAKAGHGAGKPVSKMADELADELAFLLDAIGATSRAS